MDLLASISEGKGPTQELASVTGLNLSRPDAPMPPCHLPGGRGPCQIPREPRDQEVDLRRGCGGAWTHPRFFPFTPLPAPAERGARVISLFPKGGLLAGVTSSHPLFAPYYPVLDDRLIRTVSNSSPFPFPRVLSRSPDFFCRSPDVLLFSGGNYSWERGPGVLPVRPAEMSTGIMALRRYRSS
ncbi:hypothetical protein SKAU_G00203020 [Synaphobranchus kaupii]|uniref:Uncharacterized protein n=1 Tax=Synaphobranchus kaupii TaxID=118154 RepID=A0A9Q1FGC5_SYNKA|nr:hypothetical protein SKAU_G00203020 [Synaphobranchus kaupii]